jgi:putative ABC transport system ATP-binding protein
VENVQLPLFYQGVGPRARRERALAQLQAVGLTARAHHLPAQLSGGERQRTAIARALVTEPALLLADEPTGNLDSRTGAEILALFHQLHERGRALVMITHDRSIAARLPRVLELADGAIVREGRPA